MTFGEVCAIAAIVLLPAVTAIIVLGGEPVRMMDRPLYSGQLWDRDFVPQLERGLLAALGFGVVFGSIIAAATSRFTHDVAEIAAHGMLIGVATSICVALCHSFWLADGVDETRLRHPTDRELVAFDYFAMDAAAWAQAAPYFALTIYGAFGLAVVVGVSGFHMKGRHS